MKTLIIASLAVTIQFSLLAAIVPVYAQRAVKGFVASSMGADLSRVPAVVAVNK